MQEDWEVPISAACSHSRSAHVIKHFAANNQETEREYLNVICEEDVLRDLYLKAFEIAIREGKPAAVMTSLRRSMEHTVQKTAGCSIFFEMNGDLTDWS